MGSSHIVIRGEPTDKMIDRHDWKHYLPTTLLTKANNVRIIKFMYFTLIARLEMTKVIIKSGFVQFLR